MYDSIILSFGYAESQSAAQIFFTQDPYVDEPVSFETKEAALKSLAEDLLERYKANEGISVRKCCKSNLGKSGVDFCPKCGTRLDTVGKIYKEEFRAYLLEMLTGVCDGWSTEYEPKWTPFGSLLDSFSPDTTIVVDINAEDILCYYVKEQLVE